MIKSLLAFLVLGLSVTLSAQKSKEQFLIIGTYTAGSSDGIYVYKFNTETGENSFVSSVKTSNPSYLAISPNKKYVYAVNENADSTRFTVTGHVAAFSFDKTTGKLTFINKHESGGKHPCYVSIDKTGKWVIVGNYSSGSLAVLPVRSNGSLDSAVQVIQHEGSSVNSERQEAPHVHATVLNKNNKTLYVPDLGLDEVVLYNLDTKTGKLKEFDPPFVATEPGAGPRHIDIHPNGNYAYLMEELTGSVSAYRIEKNGYLSLVQNISGLPRDFTGEVGSADIHVSPDGKFLYCSNRGESNTIGIFSINKSNGQLEWIDHQSTLGKTPRNFNFDPTGNFLLVANQNSDEIVIFKRDKETGLLTDSGKRVKVSKPVCLKWIAVE
ncbi:MAG TPA: lactonase family protein [Chitinophagaceae bacterium]